MRRLHSAADDEVGEVAEVEEPVVPPLPGVLVVGEDPSFVDGVVGCEVDVELVELDEEEASRVVVVAGAMATGASAT